MKNFKVLKKYLQRNHYTNHHLEPREAFQGGDKKFKNCIIIAACDEYDYLPRLLKSLNQADKIENCAVIIVINNPSNASKKVIDNNLLTLSASI